MLYVREGLVDAAAAADLSGNAGAAMMITENVAVSAS